MSRARTPRPRPAAAVALVLAATAVGTLAGPAGAAPAAPVTSAVRTAAAAESTFPFPSNEFVLGAGPTGILTSPWTGVNGPRKSVWRRYADGATTEFVGSATSRFRGSQGTDLMVRSEGTRHFLYDLAKGGDPVVIDSPHKLSTVNGSTLVMLDAAGKVRLVSRTPGGATVDRGVTGLTGKALEAFDGLPGTVAVETWAEDAKRISLVDVATAAVTESYAIDVGAGFVQVTPERLAWHPSSTTTRVVDRRTGRSQTFPYPAGLALGGDWLAITETRTVGGVTYPNRPVVLKSLFDGRQFALLDEVEQVVHDSGGTLLRGGTFEEGRGLFRLALDANGAPAATMIGDGDDPLELVLRKLNIQDVYRFDGTDPLITWEFNHLGVTLDLELTHTASGRTVTLHDNMNDYIRWNGELDRRFRAFNGAYTWKLTARPNNGLGPDVVRTGTTTVQRGTVPRDFNDNAGPDALVRDSAGNLTAYEFDQVRAMSAEQDCWDDGCPPWVPDVQPTVLGTGWNTYTLMASPSDRTVVGRDRDGVLWLHRNEKQKLLPRTKVGGGWQVYNKLVGGSDLNNDGRGDLLATDTSGVLWFYASTGDATRPFKPRVRVGGGWQVYNLLVAPGNLAGASGGDLLARDKDGVLWMYLGKGDGTFTARRQVGGGWQKYTHLVPAGTNEGGTADLYAVGTSGSALYPGLDSTTRPFGAPRATLLRADATRFKTFF
ncbi:hypothetical protein [Streptomyces sp. NPDC058758]|uniref:hypothetical protein n=1 Tax=Streptomyces sp. NPDC058758 TaxID=3346627 RepID=UPI0036A621CB